MEDEQCMSSGCDRQVMDANSIPSSEDDKEAVMSVLVDVESCGLVDQSANACQVYDREKKRKKAARIIGWGLRKFSMIVCERIQSKGRTTYNEVADEIVEEMTSLDKGVAPSLEQKQIYLRRCIQRKASFLKELEEKCTDLQNLILRNQQKHKSGPLPSEGVALPFVLVRTRPQGTVEIEISEDMRFVHFDFNGTSFSLHDDAAILKVMRPLQLGIKNVADVSDDETETTQKGLASQLCDSNNNNAVKVTEKLAELKFPCPETRRAEAQC